MNYSVHYRTNLQLMVGDYDMFSQAYDNHFIRKLNCLEMFNSCMIEEFIGFTLDITYRQANTLDIISIAI